MSTRSRLPAAVDQALAEAGVVQGDGVVVAVSGGIDSVVLLDLLQRSRFQLRLHVAHLNHRLRRAADADAQFVAAEAARRQLPATLESADVAGRARDERHSVEEAGRAARYDLLHRVRQQQQCRWVAVGHHADDQAETLLLRLFRGAGSTGLGSMAPVRRPGVIRPLLSLRRRQILEYAEDHGLAFREDPSNDDLRVPRNRVRHRLLPLLQQEYNPAVVDALNRTAALLRAEDEHLESEADDAARRVLKHRRQRVVTLDAPALLGYHIAVRRRVLRQYIQELAPGTPASWTVVKAAADLLVPGATRMRDLGRGLLCQCDGRQLILRQGDTEAVQATIRPPGHTSVPGYPLRLTSRFVETDCFDELRPGLTAWRVAFDAGVADAELSLRSPRPGDRLQPLGMAGRHKKLSDCFIDAKWPRILRPEALLLTRRSSGRATAPEDEEIIWVAGLTRCESYRVSARSRRILLLEFEP